MPETTAVVSGLSGNEKVVPPVTSDLKKASDDRMSKLLKHAQRYSGAAVPVSTNEREKLRSEKVKGAEPTQPAEAVSVTEPAKPKQDEVKEPAEKVNDVAEASEPTTADGKPDWQKLTEHWRGESKKFQSELDSTKAKRDEELKELDSLRTRAKELEVYEQQVKGFTSDPIGYMMKYAPDLAKQIQSLGDPVKMLEKELTDFQTELDKAFRKQFGEDWRFSETEALRPGTPSFRYKLAVDDQLSEIRGRYRNHQDTQRRKQEEVAKKVAEDREKLVKEFNFTEADFKEADKYFAEHGLTYYDTVRALLVDKIIQRKLDAILPAPPAPADTSEAPKGDASTVEKKVKVSDQGKQILARLGRRALDRKY